MCVSQHHLGLVEGLDEQWARKRKKKYCNRCNLGGVFPIIKSLKLRISLQYSAFSQTSPDRLRSLRRCQFSLLLLSRCHFSQYSTYFALFSERFLAHCAYYYTGTMSPAMHFGVVSDSCELLFLQILLVCNLMYIRRQTEMCCAHVLNMLKLTDHG